jgi:hypothetical protein
MQNNHGQAERSRVAFCQLYRSKIGRDNNGVSVDEGSESFRQQGNRTEMLQWNGESRLSGRAVEIDGYNTLHTAGFEQISYHSNSHWLSPSGSAILTRVTEVWKHGGQPAGTGAAAGIRQKNNLQKILVNRWTRRLDKIDVAFANVFLELDV